MVDIHDINEIRDKRKVKGILQEVAEYQGIENATNLLRDSVTMDCTILGAPEPDNDQLHFIFYGENGGKEPETEVIGALRLTAAQWEALKKQGDQLLEDHQNAAAQNK